MKPMEWADAEPEELRLLEGVCLDIDETLSTGGKLTAEAFAALWELKDAGFRVVPITGRPAGWCDHIARFWPVDAVIGENGAFSFCMEGGVRRRLDTLPGDDPVERRRRIEELGKAVRAVFPDARWASDQPYREYDLAIDICEDVRPWPAERVARLLELCQREGAHAKVSSVHVNAWFGDYDKRSGLERWGRGLDWDRWLFIGDSPNDEPMFAFFRNSVGVANLRRYLGKGPGKVSRPPRWITRAESGKGFAEMVAKLVAARPHEA
jgi:HAD superfamily hydrolase (TIGR01484 family)